MELRYLVKKRIYWSTEPIYQNHIGSPIHTVKRELDKETLQYKLEDKWIDVPYVIEINDETEGFKSKLDQDLSKITIDSSKLTSTDHQKIINNLVFHQPELTNKTNQNFKK